MKTNNISKCRGYSRKVRLADDETPEHIAPEFAPAVSVKHHKPAEHEKEFDEQVGMPEETEFGKTQQDLRVKQHHRDRANTAKTVQHNKAFHSCTLLEVEAYRCTTPCRLPVHGVIRRNLRSQLESNWPSKEFRGL
ncbi:hypothetical protein [Stutzerimonas zhaodongensis]|uniref:hypothetical protein n=1 Tax=Stutzerimonas TaxID=2901164 RepID=UPI00388FF8CA